MRDGNGCEGLEKRIGQKGEATLGANMDWQGYGQRTPLCTKDHQFQRLLAGFLLKSKVDIFFELC